MVELRRFSCVCFPVSFFWLWYVSLIKLFPLDYHISKDENIHWHKRLCIYKNRYSYITKILVVLVGYIHPYYLNNDPGPFWTRLFLSPSVQSRPFTTYGACTFPSLCTRTSIENLSVSVYLWTKIKNNILNPYEK